MIAGERSGGKRASQVFVVVFGLQYGLNCISQNLYFEALTPSI